jgi:hypothetical protein
VSGTGFRREGTELPSLRGQFARSASNHTCLLLDNAISVATVKGPWLAGFSVPVLGLRRVTQ